MKGMRGPSKIYETPRDETFLEMLPESKPEDKKSADKAFECLKENPKHPSLHFKRIGNFYSIRVDLSHRALGVKDDEGYIWVWIGNHEEYEELLKRKPGRDLP